MEKRNDEIEDIEDDEDTENAEMKLEKDGT